MGSDSSGENQNWLRLDGIGVDRLLFDDWTRFGASFNQYLGCFFKGVKFIGQNAKSDSAKTAKVLFLQTDLKKGIKF